MYQRSAAMLRLSWTSFADLVDARWRSLATPDDPTGHERAPRCARASSRSTAVSSSPTGRRARRPASPCAAGSLLGRLHGRCIAAWGAWPHGAREFSPLLRHVAGEVRPRQRILVRPRAASRRRQPRSPAAATSWPPGGVMTEIAAPALPRPLRPGPAAAAVSRGVLRRTRLRGYWEQVQAATTSRRVSATGDPRALRGRARQDRRRALVDARAGRAVALSARACAAAAWSGRCTASCGNLGGRPLGATRRCCCASLGSPCAQTASCAA